MIRDNIARAAASIIDQKAVFSNFSNEPNGLKHCKRPLCRVLTEAPKGDQGQGPDLTQDCGTRRLLRCAQRGFTGGTFSLGIPLMRTCIPALIPFLHGIAWFYVFLLASLAMAQEPGVSQIQRSAPLDRSALGTISRTLEAAADMAPNVAPSVAHVSDARFSQSEGITELQLDLSAKVDYRAFLLADPPRAVIDLSKVDFRLQESEPSASDLVASWRRGLFSRDRSRIVMDLTGPAAIERLEFVDAAASRPAYLSVKLGPASPAAFRAAVQSARLTAPRGVHDQRPPTTASTSTKGDRLPVRGNTAGKPLVVLDPGHGGLDYGTIGASGTPEKAVVLAFSRALAATLEETGDYAVQLTRNSDVFIALDQRVQFARDRGADLFISIHADSVRQNYVRGASVYTVSQRASDEIARELAEKENRSDMLAGVTLDEEEDVVADILVDLMRRETKTFSVRFADVVVDEMRPRIRLVSNPHRYAGFRVLRAPDVPSVLVELGFLSNKKDEALLTSDDWQDKAIASLLASIDRFFGNTTVERE